MGIFSVVLIYILQNNINVENKFLYNYHRMCNAYQKLKLVFDYEIFRFKI